ncbi:MAG: dienelactone hydrolase family protein [Candidatus Shapirobacteria bacterium]|nr:dienelactone hydrolase family protein [Candidatus Shapirobacteria bacterium]
MAKILGILLLIGMVVVGVNGFFQKDNYFFDPRGQKKDPIEKKLEKYDFDSLKKRGGVASEIKFIREPTEVDDRRIIASKNSSSKVFIFESDGKKISGVINFRNDGIKRPAIIMVRGYADKLGYYPGSGSWKMADKLAGEGFNTVSIDFLGYGLSDDESLDILETRFEKVMTVLDLIESVKKLPFVDDKKIGIWAHSNGGQIALSILEITGGNYPTTLWAPMTNPFPNSVLDTASDLDDNGRLVIEKIKEFKKYYDVRRYAFENYLSWIKAPIMLHQGTADTWIKLEWQKNLQSRLKELNKEVWLSIYSGDDHNLSKNWEMVAERDIQFFKNKLIINN